jgi:cardiolipin synthase
MIFSRYAVSFIIILLEIAFYVLLVFRFSFLSLPAFAFLTLLNVLSAIVVINRDSHPEYKASWLAAIVALPYLGLVLYLLFYSRSASKKHLLYIEKINKNLTEDKREMKNSEVLERLDALDSLASGKARAIMNDDGLAKIYGESNSTFFKSGEDMFESMLSDLREAKDYVFLEYFIIDLGYMWDSIHEILVEKAKEGVEVRVMYDDIGS